MIGNGELLAARMTRAGRERVGARQAFKSHPGSGASVAVESAQVRPLPRLGRIRSVFDL